MHGRNQQKMVDFERYKGTQKQPYKQRIYTMFDRGEMPVKSRVFNIPPAKCGYECEGA